jgi:hypothetical protein
MAFELDPSYKQVPERIKDFKERYPEGSLQPLDKKHPYKIETMPGGQVFVVYVAAAYRSPRDKKPGIGSAWEIYPGKTPYTKESELQNAETSAWGRAIVAALASESKAVASAEDVRNRQAAEAVVEPWQHFGYQAEADFDAIHAQVTAAWAQLTPEQVEIVRAWLEEKDIRRKWPLPADVADALFDRLRALAAQETPQDGTSQPVAATAPAEPSVAPSGSSESPEAPTPARAPSSRDLERLAKTPEQAQAVLDRAIREVAILSASAVSVALGERQLSKAGNNNERRRRLAAAMAVEDLEKNPDADVVPIDTEFGERIAAAQATSFRQPAAEGEEPPAADQVPEEHEFGDPGDTRQLDEAGQPVADDSEPF